MCSDRFVTGKRNEHEISLEDHLFNKYLTRPRMSSVNLGDEKSRGELRNMIEGSVRVDGN